MKAAIVLSMESPSLKEQTGEINERLTRMTLGISWMELWLFYQGEPPEFVPGIDGSVSAVKLIALKNAHLPEAYLESLEQLTGRCPMDLVLFASDGLGKELATRLGYRLKGSCGLQVQDYCFDEGKMVVTKPVYGNNLKAEFILEHPPFCLSMAKHPCPRAKLISVECPEIIELSPTQNSRLTNILTLPDRLDSGLTGADIVLVVGQGAKNKETLSILQRVATSIGASLGASRPVVMNAWTDMERLVGISGLILSPNLCIAAGVSGTAVFTAGIRTSEFIVAINTDKNAPIFQIAHVGIIGDLKAILMELEKVILSEKEKRTLQKGHPLKD